MVAGPGRAVSLSAGFGRRDRVRGGRQCGDLVGDPVVPGGNRSCRRPPRCIPPAKLILRAVLTGRPRQLVTHSGGKDPGRPCKTGHPGRDRRREPSRREQEMVGWKPVKGARPRHLMIALGVSVAIGVLGPWWLGSQLVEPAPHAVPLPGDFPARALTIPGTRIAAWWLDQGAGSPVVLLLHSIRADRSSMLSRARLLVRHGFSVALIDLQAHGETPGTAITFGWRESADVRSALSWLRREAAGRRGRRHRVLARRRRAPARSAAGRCRRGRPRSGLPALPPRHREPHPDAPGGPRAGPDAAPARTARAAARRLAGGSRAHPVDRPARRAGARGGGLSR